MDTFIDRLEIERKELHQKMKDLNTFLHHPDLTKKLDEENISLLEIQYSAMEAYWKVLYRRIKINKK